MHLLNMNCVSYSLFSAVMERKKKKGGVTVDGGSIATVQKHADDKLACQ